MSNQKVDEDVHWAVWRAVRWAVDRVVDDDVWGAAEDAVVVAVHRAVHGDPEHPVLQDFLLESEAL